jgi:hypothetical protein
MPEHGLHGFEVVSGGQGKTARTVPHPGTAKFGGELGTLLIAAARYEAASGTQPAIDYDDDRMRGHVLVETSAAEVRR